MTDEYMPTTEDIRDRVVYGDPKPWEAPSEEVDRREQRFAEAFDRWLAEHDRQERAEAVRSVAAFVIERFQYGKKLIGPSDEDLAGDARVRALVLVMEEVANRIERGDPGTEPNDAGGGS